MTLYRLEQEENMQNSTMQSEHCMEYLYIIEYTYMHTYGYTHIHKTRVQSYSFNSENIECIEMAVYRNIPISFSLPSLSFVLLFCY